MIPEERRMKMDGLPASDSESEIEEDPLPTDMLDEDIDWENSAFFTKKRRGLDKGKLLVL